MCLQETQWVGKQSREIEHTGYKLGNGSPPIWKSPIFSCFKTDERNVTKAQSKGYKETTSNTTFVSPNLLTPKKSDPSLSLPNKPLSSSPSPSLHEHQKH